MSARDIRSSQITEITIAVKDSGIGINNVDLSNLFKPYFVTTDPESKRINTNSHGIGLSVCKKIAEALEGDLSVKSKFGVGTTFTLRFLARQVDG